MRATAVSASLRLAWGGILWSNAIIMSAPMSIWDLVATSGVN